MCVQMQWGLMQHCPYIPLPSRMVLRTKCGDRCPDHFLFRKGSLRAGARPRITDSPFVLSSVRPFVCVLTGIELWI